MKYAVWLVRLVFAAWMIPAGLNHFVPIFPQPMGSQPLSHELIVALIDSGLFDLVKAVELLAGICVLFGFYTPLALLLCMPVSFCVFYWDAALEGWGSRAALFGYSVLLCNVLLCLAHIRSYRTMFLLHSKQLFLVGRLAFGVWMLANGINHFFLPLWLEPAGTTPLAAQLMAAFIHSSLFDVAMAIELVAGLLILTGFLVPVALCVLMPVSTCALYWSLILEHRPLGALLAIIAIALNGALMLASLRYYKGALQRHALTLGETSGRTVYASAFANASGRTARGPFVAALVTLLVAMAFYAYLVTGRTAQFCLLVLVLPFIVLHARRLHDMGHNAWLLVVPAVLLVTTFGIWLKYFSFGAQLDAAVPLIALAVSVAFAVWGCIGKGQAEANGFGAPAAA
jgi:uncharacterized membrane protein YhaH (DUF805 family)/uncharacterized membrane protein YphA (DoxX/SURF4 family)